MTKTQDAIFDVVAFVSDDLLNNQELYKECLTTVLDHTPELSEKLINEILTKGKTLVEIDDYEQALKKRDELLLFGLRCQIYPSVKSFPSASSFNNASNG